MNNIELLKSYEVITGRKPVKGDLVYVSSQKAVYEVVNVDRMYVRIEREKGQTMTLPPSQYKIVEKK